MNYRLLSSLPRCLVLAMLSAIFGGASLSLPVWAAASPPILAEQVKLWNAELTRSEKSLAQPEQVSDDDLLALDQELTRIRLRIRTAVDKAASQIAETREQLDTLGPAPTAGQSAETDEIARKRKAVSEKLAVQQGAVTESELAFTQAGRLLNNVATLRRRHFASKLLSRSLSPLNPRVWHKALPEISEHLEQTQNWLASWWNVDSPPKAVLGLQLVGGVFAAWLLVLPLRVGLRRRLGAEAQATSQGKRLGRALLTGLADALFPMLATLAVFLLLVGGGELTDVVESLANKLLAALMAFYFMAAFGHAAASPSQASWRLAPLSDDCAHRLGQATGLLSLVFALDFMLDVLSDQLDTSLELAIIHKSLSGLLVSLLLLGMLRREVWARPSTGGDEAPCHIGRGWRYLFSILVLSIPVSALLGYVALSSMLADQIVLTVGLYIGVGLLRQMVAETLSQALAPNSAWSLHLRRSLGLGEEGGELLRFWVSGMGQSLVIAMGAGGLLMLWGGSPQDIKSWAYTLFFGFKLGTITISLVDILSACLLFAGVLLATRLIQRALERHLFSHIRLDTGLRNSIHASLGYLGFMLAVVAAIGELGMDLSSLAVIAGALSVGIGFGLQTIVNNFVSGLILLFERPIKAGDWVVVGEHQGLIKKIRVRATEISTFDRSSVFIPNSNLIASPMVNRTYADKLGRVLLPLALAHGSDLRQARQLLLDMAKAHPEVCKTPPPSVNIKGFALDSVNMELIALVYDVEKVALVTTDLCFEIDDTFRREGIHLAQSHTDTRLALDGEQLDRLLRSWQQDAPSV